MPAYAMVTREKTREAAELVKEHPAITRAIHGRDRGPLEGRAAEDIIIPEFSTCEDAKAWYACSAHQAASTHRHQGGDDRIILTEGVSAH